MKSLCTFTFLLFFPFFLSSQNLAVEQGESIIRESVEKYEQYFDEGKFEEAAKYAEIAYQQAVNIGKVELQAKALSRQGKALSETPGARNSVLNRAFKLFEESNFLTSNTKLELDNLIQMERLAKRLKKKREVLRLKAEITAIKGGQLAKAANEKVEGVLNRRKKAMEEFKKVEAEKDELAEAVSELSEEQKLMRQQQTELMSAVMQKEKAIQKMNQEQMRQELILSEQERMLDSMLFENILDSFDLAQKEMLVQQQQAELREQEIELQYKNSQRNLLLVGAGAIVLFSIGLFHRFYSIKKHNSVLAEKNSIIEKEQKRSDELLLNILPASIAEELKNKGVAATQHYDVASVMFVDFRGFSHIAKKMTAEKLVSELDYAFKHFDGIIGKYELEKIKTIGDEYMCAGGLPEESPNHPVDMVQAALEIQAFLAGWNKEKRFKKEPTFEARIGIHTGPLIAGVVGSKKFAYDIWGDTVNVASRMESSSEVGRVNISASTFLHVKKEFECEYRGKVPAKNVGEVEMYFVNTPKGAGWERGVASSKFT